MAIDKDGGVTMDDIADATREVSRLLDDTNLMGQQPYTLEVSSPGVERPLTLPRHWRRNLGRLVTVTFDEGAPLTGRITESDSDGALLDVEGAERRLEYAEVKRPRSRSSSRRSRPDGHRHEHPADAGAREGISFDVLVEAIEQALLTAYHKSHDGQENARVALDRKTGHVTVMAQERDEEGNVVAEYEDTPEGFGRIAATTAKQIMLQRLRDAEDERKFGEFLGKEGDIVSGLIQQGRNPDDVMVDLGRLEALLPSGERVPGEDYSRGTRIKCL